MVGQQHVGNPQVTMHIVVAGTITVRVVVVLRGRRYFVVQHPGRFIISLYGGRQKQGRGHNRKLVTIQTLYILIGVTECHVVLIAVTVNNARLNFDKLDLHGLVYTSCVAVEIKTGSFHGTFLTVVVETNVV